MRTISSRRGNGFYPAADILFACISLLFTLAALKGTLQLSPLGAGMDSDLQNYAQILEAARYPAAFAADPVARLFVYDPGVPNLLTDIAGLFSSSENVAVAILKAGAIALWLHLLSWYALGRYLWGRASLATLLSLACSITFYWAYGTYWGATQAEPVPRVFFNSCLALFIGLALPALQRYGTRLLLAALLGASIFVHSVSALMAGAMFLTSFLLLPCQGEGSRFNPARHVLQTLGCTLLYLVPVACFLFWRVPVAQPSGSDLALLEQVRSLRFANNWQDVWGNLFAVLAQYTYKIPLLSVGVLLLVFLLCKKDLLPRRIQALPKLLLVLIVGVAAGCLACFAEMQLAFALGRQPMSQEMLRGTRFLIPLCLLSITCLVSIGWRKLPRIVAACAVVAGTLALFLLSQDRQVMAARYSLASVCHLEAEDSALREQQKNRLEVEAMQAIDRLVPQNESIFAPDDTMAVRYIARHPLQAVHKDGNIIYYARDVALARTWLREQKMLAARPDSIISVWLESDARWLLVRKTGRYWPTLAQNQTFGVVFDNADWQLLSRP